MQFEGNRFCFNKQQRNTNIHILGFFEASKLMGILCLTGIFDTYVYSTLKKKTSFFQNITSNYKHFGQRPGFNEKSQFPKGDFFQKTAFSKSKTWPPRPKRSHSMHPNGTRSWQPEALTVLASKRGTSEFFPVDSLIFLIFWPEKKNSPIYFTYRVDQFSFLNFWGG